MKRLILLVLCLMLLCGCQADKANQTTPETTPAPTQPQYLPQGQLSGSGLQTYAAGESVVKLGTMGQNLLIVTTMPDSSMRLTVLSGTKPAVLSQRKLEQGVSLDACFQVSSSGVGYYLPLENCLVILDRDLHEVSRTALPQDIQGTPVVSKDLSTVYYCTADQIRVLELKTGVSRLLKQHNCQSQSLVALANEEKLLVCALTLDGQEQTVFIATEDGRTLGTDLSCVEFLDGEEGYYLRRQDGLVTEYVFGSYEGQAQNFAVALQEKNIFYLPQTHSMVMARVEENALALEAYRLDSGKQYASLSLSGVKKVHSFAAVAQGIWFVTQGDSGQNLCFWDTGATAVENGESFTTAHYTAQSPDRDGLAELQARADALGQQYGVRIIVTPEDVPQPEDYTLTTEHQTKALEIGLAALERALPRFPEDFFSRIVEDTGNKVLTISLVRSISDNQEGLQYWLGADAHIAVAMGENVEQQFYHELCHVLDAFIYANTRDMDVWNTLNPQGFAYDYSYELYKHHGTEYLEGKNQAFIDNFSRTYPKEDRARVWEYALMPDKEASFDSEIMQAKLRLLSASIRDAFNWKRDSREFPWEYYLEEPLAYQKKK